MNKEKVKLFIIGAIFVIFIFSISCTPELQFGELVICQGIDQETNAPKDSKDLYNAEEDSIHATILCRGVKASDVYSFKWINITTGETLLDESSEYQDGRGYFEGYVASSIHTTEEVKLFPPGNYNVEFFHNGKLEKEKSFMVQQPQVKILEVSLASETDISGAPADVTREFNEGETVYVCVKSNYLISGNTITTKWYSEDGEMIFETSTTLEEDYYEESYTVFNLSSSEEVLTPGDHTVEVYLNDSIHESYEFTISESPDLFSQGQTYVNDKFQFRIAIPDGWSYSENENDEKIQVGLQAEEKIPAGFSVIASAASDKPQKEDYSSFSNTVLQGMTTASNWSKTNQVENEFKTVNGIQVDEFVYTYQDQGGNEWIMVTAFVENNGVLYIIFGMARYDYYEMADDIYHGMVNSLEFNGS
ncbi:MAG: hypothetical protein ACQEP2_04230 [Actinomycetota bacterium]